MAPGRWPVRLHLWYKYLSAIAFMAFYRPYQPSTLPFSLFLLHEIIYPYYRSETYAVLSRFWRTWASLILLVSATILGIVTSLPTDERPFARGGKLVARGANLNPSCDRSNPFKPSEKFSAKANAALADVKTIANEVTSGTIIKGDVPYRISDAFLNYFSEEQYDQVMKTMSVVADSDSYTFNILCGSDQDTKSCELGSFAATNPNPGSPNIVLCDKFFDPSQAEVKNDLSARDSSNSRRGWCQVDEAGNPANKFPFFAVAGLTLFHEITHLDLVGAAAGLTERTINGATSHGTVDVYEIGGDVNINHYKRGETTMLPYDAARQLDNLWNLYDLDNGNYKPLAQTFENAESYAASALQWHFKILCEFSIESNWSEPK